MGRVLFDWHDAGHLGTFFWRNSPQWVRVSSFTRTTVGRTPLDESWALRKDLYLTSHNTHNRQTSMPPVGFEPAIPADERPQTYALDRAVTGTGLRNFTSLKYEPSLMINVSEYLTVCNYKNYTSWKQRLIWLAKLRSTCLHKGAFKQQNVTVVPSFTQSIT